MLLIAATERELSGLDDLPHARLVCGIGPVDAAAATASALEGEGARPSAVLHVGLAGAHGFTAPELVLGSEAVYCDAGSPFVAGRIVPDAGLLAAARAALPDASVCPIGTSARVGGSAGCDVDVEAMEGFAVLRACELARVPALELRAVANEIGEPDRAKWQFEEGLALLRVGIRALVEALDGSARPA
jgi:nucleoside phosphorylase